MKRRPKGLFIGGLIIGGMIFIIGAFLIFDAIVSPYLYKNKLPKNNVAGRILPNGEVEIYTPPKNNIAKKIEKNSTKPDAAGTYFEGTTIPKLTEQDMWVAMMTWHQGAQTVKDLMDSYQVAYLQNDWRRKIDKRHPPEQWLQHLLDKGFTILNFGEYAQYMDARVRTDIFDKNPGRLREKSELYGIPVSNKEKIKEVYLENHLLFLKRKNDMERTVGEPVTGGVNIGDKVLPFYKNREVVYVQRIENSTSTRYYGTLLSPLQRFNLNFRGIEPEGIEIIYIDEMGNQLSDKPEPITRETVRNIMKEGEKPPPEEWWDKEAPVPDPEDIEKFLPTENESIDTELEIRRQRAREEFAKLDEVAQVEFEKFMQKVRQLEKFATMSDAEIAAEIEKQLLNQMFPDLQTEESLEEALREMITPKPLTSERYEKAMQTLERHGPKEGLRRLVKDDPELAKYFLRNPKKVAPKSSQPVDSTNLQKE